MKAPRVRFTIRRMMILVVVVAVFLAAGFWVHDRYWGSPTQKTYSVGDLCVMAGESDPSNGLNDVVDQLKASVTPDVWWSSRRSVVPFFLSQSVIVRHSEEGHRQVSDWLKKRRSSRSGHGK